MSADYDPVLFDIDDAADSELEQPLSAELKQLNEQGRAAHARLAEFDRVWKAKRQPLSDAVLALCDAYDETRERLDAACAPQAQPGAAVTSWQIDLAAGRRVVVDADQARVIDGALILTRGTEPPPAPLRIVAIFAPRTCELASVPDAGITAAEQEPPPPQRSGPRLLPAIETPNQIADRPW
jgi:hypothetical protein